MRTPVTLLVACVLAAGCTGAEAGTATVSVTVEDGSAARLVAGSTTLEIPAGGASNGTVTVAETASPEDVPVGVVPLGPAVRLTVDGAELLTEPATLGFQAPPTLTSDHVPVVLWQVDGGGWEWLPTERSPGERTVTAPVEGGSVGFLGRFDRRPWVERLEAGFVRAVTRHVRAPGPPCGETVDGLQVAGDSGRQVRWCVGTTGGQTVLTLTNNTGLFQEVAFPEAWPLVDAVDSVESVEAVEAVPDGDDVRRNLGFAPEPPSDLATRILPTGVSLSVALPEDPRGAVTTDVTPASWALSTLAFAGRAYAQVTRPLDPQVGAVAREATATLVAGLGDPEPLEDTGLLVDCLSPVSDLGQLTALGAQELTERVLGCLPTYVRPRVAAAADPAMVPMATAVAADVLTGLAPALELSDQAWARVPDQGDPERGFTIRLGPPPPEEHDYEGAPWVFRPGESVAVEEWSPDLEEYVAERLDHLLQTNPAPEAGCAYGAVSVRRYRSDGFALGGQISCDGEVHALVLGRLSDGWHEIDDIQEDELFSCDLMGIYSVPAFIAGDQCLSGATVEDYP